MSRGKGNPALRCPRCYLLRAWCLCAYVPRVQTTARFLVVRHMTERFKGSNTARLVPLALPNSELWDLGVPGEPLDTSGLGAPGDWLLFPSAQPLRAPPVPPPRRIIVVDGSWTQARRMVQRIGALREMPRFALPAAEAPLQRLRRPPRDDGLSTLEAVAAAVERLGDEPGAELLRRLHALFVGCVLATRG
ncbi:MAG: DTW domain-containing protein [Deltaproteobacteria bacterium]|nr:DTW domain-containing protein [Deltaproteobacteria bacterium]